MTVGSFEQWLVGQQREASRRAREWGRELHGFGKCECCGADGVELPMDNSCLACAKYSFGSDEATEHTGFRDHPRRDQGRPGDGRQPRDGAGRDDGRP